MSGPQELTNFDVIGTLVKNRCATKIRLSPSRLWNASPPGKLESESGLDVVAIDEEGKAIHIVIERKYAPFYRQMLKEGSVYIFSNIACVPAAHYRPVARGERLRVTAATKVYEDVDFNGHIKRHHFEFQPFSTAATRVKKDMFLTDLIGVITKIEDPLEGNTRFGIGTRSKFYIQDMDGNEFPVNLWGDLSLSFREFNLLDKKQTTVIVVCAMAVREFEGEVHVSSISTSKFYINLDIPEVLEYLQKFAPLQIIPQLLVKHSKRNSVAKQETTQQKTVADLITGPSPDVKFGQRYNCTATIVGFEVDRGWYYTACKKCTKKLPPSETDLGCQNCNLPQSESMPWYKLEAMVEDNTGTAVFTIFGRNGEKLFGAPATLLLNSPIMDPQCLHPIMDRSIGSTHIFQVELKENTFGDCATKIVVQNIFDATKEQSGRNVSPSDARSVNLTSGAGSSISNAPNKRVTPEDKEHDEFVVSPGLKRGKHSDLNSPEFPNDKVTLSINSEVPVQWQDSSCINDGVVTGLGSNDNSRHGNLVADDGFDDATAKESTPQDQIAAIEKISEMKKNDGLDSSGKANALGSPPIKHMLSAIKKGPGRPKKEGK